MRLIELEIECIRGINHIILKPDGRNFIISGPNGSGKSAVVDAIDFLMTGEITRLTGKGTGGITLIRHGPHIDHKPDEAKVRALIQVKGANEPVEISRCMARSNQLHYPRKYKSVIEPIIDLAKRGQHVLTRREILDYITAESSTRAAQIQKLLNIKDIENIRKTMVKVEHEAKDCYETNRKLVINAEGAICATTQLEKIDDIEVLKLVNQQRAFFGKDELQELKSDLLKKDLVLPVAELGKQSINTTVVSNDIDILKKVLDKEYQAKNRQYYNHLLRLVAQIHTDPKNLKEISYIRLLTLGSEFVDDTGVCPLCETVLEPVKFKENIQRRLGKAQSAQELLAHIQSHAEELSLRASTVQDSLRRILASFEETDNAEALSALVSWQNELKLIIDDLADPIKNFPHSKCNPDRIARLSAPEQLSSMIGEIQKFIQERFPSVTPEQAAWDFLTRLEENLKAYEAASQNLEHSDLFYRRASYLKDTFEKARDTILTDLYNEVRDRFVCLYRSLHDDDEEEFDAVLEPDGAALKLEVDFYGRGPHPPHALHSEGHQDSMGLCLYLALAERLTGGFLDLIILDDVVMSVDADHRRQLCQLLANQFKHRQFFITTHDKTWANQLKTDGVARSKDVIEFYNWRVETGPQINCESDLWEQIAVDLKKNDVPSAAAHLRRGSEEYFSRVCDSLRALVVFKLSGRWEMGDLMSGAMSRYKDLVKSAKATANSWNDREALSKLEELDSVACQVFQRTNIEQWAINPNVHYSHWADFSPQDFQPVVEAFQDLFGLFCCTQCGSLLFLEMKGVQPGSVRCNCGKVNWNLINKKGN